MKKEKAKDPGSARPETVIPRRPNDPNWLGVGSEADDAQAPNSQSVKPGRPADPTWVENAPDTTAPQRK